MAKIEKDQEEKKELHLVPGIDFDPEGWESVGYNFWNFEADPVLMGIYDGNDNFTEGEFEEPCKRHFFLVGAEKTRYSVVGGQVLDRHLSDGRIQKSALVRIQYKGQVACGKGRANQFDVRVKT